MKGYHVYKRGNVPMSINKNTDKSSDITVIDKIEPESINLKKSSFSEEKELQTLVVRESNQEEISEKQNKITSSVDKSNFNNSPNRNPLSKATTKFAINKQNGIKSLSNCANIRNQNDPIVWSIIFLALTLFGIIKMSFEIGKKPYTELTIEEIKAKRKFNELPEESTEEESEAARNLLSTSTQSWNTYTDEKGEEFIRPYKKKHLKETAAILKSVQELLPTDPLVLERLNEVGYYTNSMAKRKFAGSIPLIIVASIALLLLTLIIGGPFFPALFSSWWLIASIIFYIFASRAPQYLINKRLDYYSGRNITSSFIAGFLSIFTSTPSTETVEYTYTSGRKETVEELNWGKVFIFVIMATVFLFMGMAIHVFGLLNFLRNYVFYF
jgi:hypothetical protein